MLNLSAGSSSYNIQRSLRFRSSASAYLNRTTVSPTLGTKWTLSFWMKSCNVTTSGSTSYDLLFNTPTHNTDKTFLGFSKYTGYDNFELYLAQHNGSSSSYYSLKTSQAFRDPSAWYHIVYAWDTTQTVASSRIKMYVNGTQVTSFSVASYPPLNHVNGWQTSGKNFTIGYGDTADYFNGYMSEVNFIDGQALTPSSFGQTDPASGAWVPLKYTGTYGTNGFYLPFSNNSSTTTLGYDFSGNGNNWTTNNISLTSGATYDSMTDVPTLTSATAANYAVLNPLVSSNPTGFTGSTALLSNGNLTVTGQSAATYYASSTIAYPVTGKWYMEVTAVSVAEPFKPHTFGIGPYGYTGSSTSIYLNNYGQANNQNNLYRNTGSYINIQTTGILYTQAANDIIQFAYDADSGKIWLGINNNWIGTTGTVYNGDPATGTNPTDVFVVNSEKVFWNSPYGSGTQSHVNFGQRPFAYTPPTGFKSLNTFNLPTPAIQKGNKFMDATLYTGSSSSQIITNSGSMQPDLVWVKTRNASTSHEIYDAVRGAGIRLCSNETSADNPLGVNGLTSFNSNGFTVPSTANYGINSSGYTYVGWQWKAGGTAVTNTAGTISSQVSANPASGFSIVTYTGNGTAGATVGHGLGVAPKMIIVKNRSYGGSWRVYHSVLGNTQNVRLNLTNATATDSGIWNNTSPTSSVFTVGNDADVNRSGDPHVAYCFAEVAGYSKFGSYTGNGSADGPFVYCGGRPKFILLKASSIVGDWYLFDTSRDTYNPIVMGLIANNTQADTNYGTGIIDILSNGFKLKRTDAAFNSSGTTYIYAAFAENPFKYANAR